MKICISSTGKNMDAGVDQRFGRCQYFVVVDMETMQVKSIANEATMSSGGAGIQAAQIVSKEQVDSVITGNIGPNAFQILHAAGIKVYTGAHGTIKEVLEQYKKGMLEQSIGPNAESHAGIGGQKK